jgi:hypothetical protein
MEINKEALENLSPEQIMELAEKAQLADELKTKHDQSEADKLKLVEELKEERTKKQLAEAALATNPKSSETLDEQKTRDIFKSIINEEKTTQIEMSRQSFEAQFKTSNPEFDTSNDPGGIKYDAFKKILSRFNTSGTPAEQLAEVYSDAMVLLKKDKPTPSSQINNPYAFSSQSSGSQARSVVSDDLSPREIKLIENAGWTKEKYLKTKLNHPRYVSDLLDSIRV